MAACSCETYEVAGPNGERLTGVRVQDPECPTHGYPGDEWRTGSPLRPFSGVIERETGRYFSVQDARATLAADELGAVDPVEWNRRFRPERPSEVTAKIDGDRPRDCGVTDLVRNLNTTEGIEWRNWVT